MSSNSKKREKSPPIINFSTIGDPDVRAAAKMFSGKNECQAIELYALVPQAGAEIFFLPSDLARTYYLQAAFTYLRCEESAEDSDFVGALLSAVRLISEESGDVCAETINTCTQILKFLRIAIARFDVEVVIHRLNSIEELLKRFENKEA